MGKYRCEEVLRLLQRTNSSAQLMSGVGADLLLMDAAVTPIAAGSSAEDRLVSHWMLSSKLQTAAAAPAPGATNKTLTRQMSLPSVLSAAGGSNSSNSSNSEECTKGHLALLLPLCLDLVLTRVNAPALREVAVSLIK